MLRKGDFKSMVNEQQAISSTEIAHWSAPTGREMLPKYSVSKCIVSRYPDPSNGMGTNVLRHGALGGLQNPVPFAV